MHDNANQFTFGGSPRTGARVLVNDERENGQVFTLGRHTKTAAVWTNYNILEYSMPILLLKKSFQKAESHWQMQTASSRANGSSTPPSNPSSRSTSLSTELSMAQLTLGWKKSRTKHGETSLQTTLEAIFWYARPNHLSSSS